MRLKKENGMVELALTVVMVPIIAIAMLGTALENNSYDTIERYEEPTALSSVPYIEENIAIWVKTERDFFDVGKSITDAQLYNYLARGKSGDYLTKEEAKKIKCTKLDKNGIDKITLEYFNYAYFNSKDYRDYYFDFPVEKVKTPTKTVTADFYVTSEGKVFVWPPYEKNGELWITEEIKLKGVSLDNPKNTYKDGHKIKVGNVTITTGTTDNGINDVVFDINEVKVGDYINYNVPYVDITGYDRFTAENGWRILSAKETSKGIYDLEIISTGRPAMLYYDSSYVTDYKWAGRNEDKIAYRGEGFYTNGTLSDPNIAMVSGLYYNFEDIIFNDRRTDGSYEEGTGYYLEINNQTKGSLSGSVFRDPAYEDYITGVRSVTLADFTGSKTSEIGYIEDFDGLYAIRNVGLNPEEYFLASPRKGSSVSVYFMDDWGSVGSDRYGYFCAAVRPVVSLSGVKLGE